jgi:hypothetical protein
MIDIQSYFMSLKASWVSRLVSNQLVNWKVIPCKYFAKLGQKPHIICFLTSAKFKGVLV